MVFRYGASISMLLICCLSNIWSVILDMISSAASVMVLIVNELRSRFFGNVGRDIDRFARIGSDGHDTGVGSGAGD